jgi:hypothetical protein
MRTLQFIREHDATAIMILVSMVDAIIIWFLVAK